MNFDFYSQTPSISINLNREIILNTFINQLDFIQLYKNIIKKEDLTKFLNNFFPNFFLKYKNSFINNPLLFWRSRCLYGFITNSLPNLDDNFFINILKINFPKLFEILQPFLNKTNLSNLNENQITNIIYSIKTIFKQYYGLYLGLYESISPIFQLLGPKIVFQNFDLISLQLHPKIDLTLLQYFKAESISSTDFPFFWLNIALFNDLKIVTLFQSLFSCAEPFPKPSILFNSDNLLTLTNDSLIKKKGFIDLVISPCRTFIIDNNIEKCNFYTNSFLDFRPLLILLEFESIINDNTVFENFVNEYKNIITNNPLISNYINRFSNDIELINFLTKLIGQKVSYEDLKKFSLPKIIQNVLSTIEFEMILSLHQKNCFSISDKSILMDFSFISIYKTLFITLKDFTIFNDNNFSTYLPLVQTEELLNIQLIDLFSLIFIKKNNQFIINFELASLIINSIYEIQPKIKEFSIAKLKILYSKTLKLNNLNSCFLPLINCFSQLLSNHFFDIAELFCQNNPNLIKFLNISKDIYLMNKNKTIISLNNINYDIILLENFLSTGNDFGIKINHPLYLKRINNSF